MLSWIIRHVQLVTGSLVPEREWWRTATRSRVLVAVALRPVEASFGLALLGVGAGLYARHEESRGALVIVLACALAVGYCLCLSARRAGDLLALQLVPHPENQLSGSKQRLLIAVTVAAIGGLLWCSYRIFTQGFFGTGLARAPIVTAVAAAAAMVALAYVAIACGRAHGLVKANPPFHEALESRIYGEAWRGWKSYRDWG
jgi:hypothetical protein